LTASRTGGTGCIEVRCSPTPREHGEGDLDSERIPEAWIGQEVTVYYGVERQTQRGILADVTEQGIVVRAEQGDRGESVSWYPITAVHRLTRGRPREGVSSF